MHAARYLVFIFALLFFYVSSIPVGPARTEIVRQIRNETSVIDFGPSIEGGTKIIDKRGRGKQSASKSRSRPRPSHTIRKKTKHGKKTSKTSKPKNKKPKSRISESRRPVNRKSRSKKAKSVGKTAHANKKKQCKRTGSGTCDKTHNYRVAENAARKKGQKLQVNHAYMLKYTSGRDLTAHKKLIIGTVRQDDRGNLDFVAAASSLTYKGEKVNIQGCNRYFGAECEHKPTKKYTCGHGPTAGIYKFKGGASPEFADVEHFMQVGKDILEKNTKYNIIYNNCDSHVKKVQNVAKLKPGSNPIVPEPIRPTTPESESEDMGGSDRTSHDSGSEAHQGGLRVTNPDADSE